MKTSSVVLALAASAAAYHPARRQEDMNATTTVLANATAPVNQSYVLSVLETALPSSLVAIAVTNPAAVSSIINSQFNSNMTPSWFAALPTAVQTYLIGPSTTANASGIAANATAAGVANATATGIYNSTTGLNGTVPGNGSAVLTTIRTTNSAGMTVAIVSTVRATGASASGAAATGAAVVTSAVGASATSRAGAAIPTAVMGAGLAGIVGLVGMLAL